MAKYIYEYRTPQSQNKWPRRFRYTAGAVGVVIYIVLCLQLIFRHRPNDPLAPDIVAFFYISACLYAFLMGAGVIYNPIYLVRIRDKKKDIQVRFLGKGTIRHSIALRTIRNVAKAAHTDKDFYILGDKRYYTWILDDPSNSSIFRKSHEQSHGADLMLYNGEHIFIGFGNEEEAEKFVAILKESL